MAAASSNTHWKSRKCSGRPLIFNSPAHLLECCESYFAWVDDNPIRMRVGKWHKGQFVMFDMQRPRAMSLAGLCSYLGISFRTWCNYRVREDFFHIVTRAEEIIWEQQFTGAAAGLFNPAIILRSLYRKDSSC